MAFGNEQDVQLRPELSTNRTPIDFSVEQSAVAQLSDAWRKGLVNADDLIERYGNLAKTKEKAQIQGLEEFISPQAIEQRKNAAVAADVDAQLRSDPLYARAQQAKMQQTINEAEGGSYPAMLNAAVGLGFFPKNRDVEWTPAKKAEAEQLFAKARAYQASVAQAKYDSERWKADLAPQEHKTISGGKLTSKTVVPSGDEVQVFDQNGQFIPMEAKLEADRVANMSPAAWEHEGAKPYDPYRNLVKGKSTEQQKPAVAAEPQSYDEVIEKTTIKPDGTHEVTKKTKTPSRERVLKEETSETEKAPTEAQQRAQLALARFSSANDVFEFMKKSGYDPTSVTSWVNSFLPEIIKSGDRKTYEAAVDAWSQGLLRLESGAAISRQEKTWYDKAFFPQVNDPPAVVANKARMRHDVESMVGEIASAGGVVSPESEAQKAKLTQTYKAAGDAAGVPPTGVGFTRTITPSAPVVTRTGRKFVRDPNSPTGWSLAP